MPLRIAVGAALYASSGSECACRAQLRRTAELREKDPRAPPESHRACESGPPNLDALCHPPEGAG